MKCGQPVPQSHSPPLSTASSTSRVHLVHCPESPLPAADPQHGASIPLCALNFLRRQHPRLYTHQLHCRAGPSPAPASPPPLLSCYTAHAPQHHSCPHVPLLGEASAGECRAKPTRHDCQADLRCQADSLRPHQPTSVLSLSCGASWSPHAAAAGFLALWAASQAA